MNKTIDERKCIPGGDKFNLIRRLPRKGKLRGDEATRKMGRNLEGRSLNFTLKKNITNNKYILIINLGI